MKGDEVIEDGVVVVEGNRITAVGTRGAVAVPAGAKTIDVSGKTVLPGFVDVHWHGALRLRRHHSRSRTGTPTPRSPSASRPSHDPSNDTGEVFAAAELARAGLIRGPRIFSTGTILYGAAGDFKAEIDSLDDARRAPAAHEGGRRHLRQELQPAAPRPAPADPRRRARASACMVVPEGGSLFEHNMTMVVDGHTAIEHTDPGREHLQGRHAALAADEGRLHADAARRVRRRSGARTTGTRRQRLGEPAALEVRPARSSSIRARAGAPWRPRTSSTTSTSRRSPPALDEGRRPRSTSAPTASARVSALHWELWMLVQGGMTPHEALRCGDRSTARRASAWTATSGRSRPASSPTSSSSTGTRSQDIRQSEKVRWTMVNGRLYDAATMNETASREKKRAKYWWE